MGLDGIRKPTRAAGEMMVRMASRLLGAGSGLHLHLRQLSQVKSAEEKRLKKEMEEVDKDTWIILDNQQSEAISKAVENQTNLISIEGPPGSGKTIIGAEIARMLVEKTKEETGEEPVVIITNVSYKIKEDSPLVSQLQSRAEQMGGKFVPWSKI